MMPKHVRPTKKQGPWAPCQMDIFQDGSPDPSAPLAGVSSVCLLRLHAMLVISIQLLGQCLQCGAIHKLPTYSQ